MDQLMSGIAACVMGDVGTFVTLLDNIPQILVIVNNILTTIGTTVGIYPANRQTASHLRSAIAQIPYSKIANQSPCLTYFLLSTGRNDAFRGD